MPPDRRDILEQVARGELTPEEADELLRRVEDDAIAAPEPTASVSRIKVAYGFGAVVVVGDPDVADAEVEGLHTAYVEGDTLVIRGEADSDTPGGFAFNLGRRKVRIHSGIHAPEGKVSLRIRMNPRLALEVKIDAGPVSISGVHGPIRARTAAGPITIEDFVDTLDAAVNAGAVRAIGKISGGESRIRSDAGAVRVELDPSSSVQIFGDAALGKVVLPGADEPERRRFGSRKSATIGAGEGTLRIETAMGSIHVTTG